MPAPACGIDRFVVTAQGLGLLLAMRGDRPQTA